jgi:hypothetical protein
LPQIGAEETVVTALEFPRERTIPAVFTVIEKKRAVAVLRKETLVEEFAAVEPETIETAAVLRGVCAIQTVLLIVTSEGEVAIFVCKGVVAVLAVLRLLIDDGKSRDDCQEFRQLFEERCALAVWLSEIERIPPIGEETIMAIDGERNIRRVHRNNFPLTETALSPGETALIAMGAAQERAAVRTALW